MALNVPGELTLPSELLEQQADVQIAYTHLPGDSHDDRFTLSLMKLEEPSEEK